MMGWHSGPWHRAGIWDEEGSGKVYDHAVVRRLLPFLRPYRRQVALALSATLVTALSFHAQPWLVGLGIDGVARGKPLPHVFAVAGAVVVLAAVSWASQHFQQATMASAGHSVLYDMRMTLFRHIMSLSPAFLDRELVGRAMSRVQNDVAALQDLLAAGIVNMLSDFLGLGVITFFLFYQDALLAAVTIAVVAVMVLVLAVWQRRARQAFLRVRQAIALVNANLQENVSGVRVVQALTREQENLNRFAQINADNLMANIEAGRLAAAVMPAVDLLTALAIALVVTVGGIRVVKADLGLGALVAFALYAQRFFEPIRNLVMQYTQLQRAMAAGSRILEVLDTTPDIQDDPQAIQLSHIKGEVEFRDVRFSYVPGREVLKGISLRVLPGEKVAIVGPTGAGKSTLVSLVARLYDVTHGAVLIDGVDVRCIKRESLCRHLGVVLQEPFLFSGTVRENIRYGRPDATDEEVEEAARAVGAHDFIVRLPEGYESYLHERGQNLSLGQRQLIAFARAILADPRILILDEATASLDPMTEQLLRQGLKRLLEGRTCFIIAHRLATLQEVHRIIVLHEGRIVEEGSHQELLARQGLYAYLYARAMVSTPSGGSILLKT